MHPTPSNWIELAYDLNIALDEGATLPLQEVRAAFRRGAIIPYLKGNLAMFDPSAHTADQLLELNQAVCDAWTASSDELGVENNGICLILAMVLKALQSDHIKAA